MSAGCSVTPAEPGGQHAAATQLKLREKGTSLLSNMPLRAEVSCLKCAFSQIPVCMCLYVHDCCGYFKILKTVFLARLIIICQHRY